MTAYDGLQITLERDGKTFCIKVGEEIEVERSEREASTGVYCRTYCNVKLIGTRLVYKGGWRPSGNTIMQKLAGPLGNGTVLYPNGDRFRGASISAMPASVDRRMLLTAAMILLMAHTSIGLG